MDVIGNFYGKLRALALTLEKETAQLERALSAQETDFEEESPMRLLHDMHSEVRTLKGDVQTLLEKNHSERQGSYDFIKATKLLRQRNTVDIVKLRELFQKYGYKPPASENSGKEVAADAPGPPGTGPESEGVEDLPGSATATTTQPQGPNAPGDPARCPQLSDFGLGRYVLPSAWDRHPHAQNLYDRKTKMATPPLQTSPGRVLKTPKCALKMDDCECMTPKLEHFGISEHTMCLNNDYTMVLKKAEKTKSFSKGGPGGLASKSAATASGAEAIASSSDVPTIPGPAIQVLEENSADGAQSPLVPVFCTPGIKIPSVNIDVIASDFPKAKESGFPNCAGTPPPPDFETACLKEESEGKVTQTPSETDVWPNSVSLGNPASLALRSDSCLEQDGKSSPPPITASENLLSTPTPPEMTTIPDDILQILSRYNPNLATPVAIKATPRKDVLFTHEREIMQPGYNKENRSYY
ncbi:spindle and kinetochore-associated protein 3 isoform X2 [Ornithorhynchus anatinus]|uniref:spindle and kinetochore-associated protein 3 isoform X2 n=1 Tax=Ornithorhynchus anatinus TaxID=9258 RepID=UPI00045452A8|nr:spindle and kinetochore-associated protein 3 isoform X2 [Ornithorhynchus anatinus]